MTDYGISMIVLAGGRSSRMGQDKADLLYQGKTFLETQICKARQLGITDVVVSGYRGNMESCKSGNIRMIADAYTDKGPLGGLATCLQKVLNDWSLVLSVDSPLVPVDELTRLVQYALEKAQEGCRAALLECDEHQSPLIGMYHRSLVPAMIEEFTERKGSVFAMLRRAGYEVYVSKAPAYLFSNINDPETYHRLETGLCI